MMSIFGRMLCASLALICSLGLVVAAAAESESKVWYVQGPVQPNSLMITNLSGTPAAVAVRPFDESGRPVGGAPSVTLAPGQMISGNAGGAAYVLVIASQPVVVSAWTQTRMQPESTGGQPFPRYSYFLQAAVYPIDCAAAAPTHFACSQKMPGTAMQPGTFQRPTTGVGPGR